MEILDFGFKPGKRQIQRRLRLGLPLFPDVLLGLFLGLLFLGELEQPVEVLVAGVHGEVLGDVGQRERRPGAVADQHVEQEQDIDGLLLKGPLGDLEFLQFFVDVLH